MSTIVDSLNAQSHVINKMNSSDVAAWYRRDQSVSDEYYLRNLNLII
jgi:hypothetical protein